MDDLAERLERLRKGIAEPIAAPEDEARDPDEFYRWLLKKQGEYRSRSAQCANAQNNAPAQKEEP